MSALERIDVTLVPADLADAAWRVRSHAYAPYSGFAVGAALRDADGGVHVGANVENGSYGLGRCAEQSAIQAMASSGARSVVEVVVAADADPPATPCGACRQVLHEFSDGAVVYLVSRTGAWRTTVAALLPAGFRLRP